MRQAIKMPETDKNSGNFQYVFPSPHFHNAAYNHRPAPCAKMADRLVPPPIFAMLHTIKTIYFMRKWGTEGGAFFKAIAG